MTAATVSRRWTDTGPGFNAHAAETVYKAMSAMDADTALVFGRILVADGLRYDLIAHRGEIIKAAGAAVAQRTDALRRHYTRQAVAKTRRGQDPTHELHCLVAISKAWSFTTQERSQFARGRARDPLGRFVQEHRHVDTDDSQSPMESGQAKKRGIPEAPTEIEGQDLSHYQQAYGQIRDLLAPYRNKDLNAMLHLSVDTRHGPQRTEVVDVDAKGEPAQFAAKLKPGDRIRSAAVSVAPTGNQANTAAFEALNAMGAPRAAGRVTDAFEGALNTEKLKEFNQARRGVGVNEPHSAASRAFGRVDRGSNLLRQSLGENPPPKLAFALAVANHVGQYGPEAQKVIGPSADRMAYRYRGTERTPSRQLDTAMNLLRANSKVRSRQDLRDAIVGGLMENPDVARRVQAGRSTGGSMQAAPDTEAIWDPGPVLNYFKRHLPNPDLNELQRRSGVIPPSEGIILDRNLNIATQASGFADDWYLPFNLRHLAALRGGEYIRTRSFGGPTTEDIYTGLMSGARSLTVVSHNGVYTVDFDRTLRGGRRFNDKATRMVGRYGHLLDALRSEEVSRGDISSSRIAELSADIEAKGLAPRSAEFKAELSRARDAERNNPTLSQAEKNAAATEWMAQAAARRPTRDGRVQSIAEMQTELINEQGRRDFQDARERVGRTGGTIPAENLAQFQAAARRTLMPADATEVTVARNIAGVLGPRAEEGFERHMQKADRVNAEQVGQLSLNGAGYHDALKALKEQFPYFIDDVHYHEWRDSANIGTATTHERARDTGYVLPGHNRPNEAEAGYFDRDVTGYGKVRADTTRYQNYRVHRGEPKKADTVQRQEAATATPAAARPAVPDQAAAQQAARRVMFEALQAEKTFIPGATIRDDGNQDHDLGGADIRGEVRQDNFPTRAAGNKALQDFYGPPEAQMRAMLDNPAQAEALDRLMDTVIADARVKTDDSMVYAFRNKGQAEPPRPLPQTTTEKLAELKRDHVFEGMPPALDATRQATPQVIEAAFNADSGVARLIDRYNLPPITDTDEAFNTAAERIAATFSATNEEYKRRRGIGGIVSPDDYKQVGWDSTALLKATQYRRKWADAMKRQPPPAPPEPEPEVTTEQHNIGAVLDQETGELRALTPEQMNHLMNMPVAGVNDQDDDDELSRRRRLT